MAEPLDGPTVTAFRKKAKELNSYEKQQKELDEAAVRAILVQSGLVAGPLGTRAPSGPCNWS